MRAMLAAILLIGLSEGTALAHGVAGADATFIGSNTGVNIVPFVYFGAKHMVTGYDHILFLFGVMFYLYYLRDITLYVTAFSVGHSITLLIGVLSGFQINPYLIDAMIGLSVVYKALDNLGAFRTVLGGSTNQVLLIGVFGLFHGFGLSTKLQDLGLSQEGLITNMIAFNVGVEIGQLLALSAIFVLIRWWRQTSRFWPQAITANFVLLFLGTLITFHQLGGYFLANPA